RAAHASSPTRPTRRPRPSAARRTPLGARVRGRRARSDRRLFPARRPRDEGPRSGHNAARAADDDRARPGAAAPAGAGDRRRRARAAAARAGADARHGAVHAACGVRAGAVRSRRAGAGPGTGSPSGGLGRIVTLAVASWEALGTTASVIAAAEVLADARAEVERELAAIDAACSRFREDSELTRVNRAGGRPVAVGPLLLEAVETALRVAAATGGDVDPTVGRALRLAGYDRDYAELRPSRSPLRAVAVAGWRTVTVDRRTGAVRVPAGVALD